MERAKAGNPVFHGLWRPSSGYSLDGDAFNHKLQGDILARTGLHKSEWLGDWWVHPDDNPELTWAELIEMALGILTAEATRLYCGSQYLKAMPSYTVREDLPLVERGASGAKRINASAGEWHDYRGAMGWEGAFNPHRDAIFANPPVHDSGDRFRLSGKDEGCCVEGTWHDWVCFACNVLASPNTEALCPELYEPAFQNDNY